MKFDLSNAKSQMGTLSNKRSKMAENPPVMLLVPDVKNSNLQSDPEFYQRSPSK